MTLLPPDIKDVFFRRLTGDVPVEEFEQWLYHNKEIEQVLTPDDYLELISLNYKKSGACYELKKMLEKQIDPAEFETYNLMQLLDAAALMDDKLPEILVKFYDLYCSGYSFLCDIGIGYGLLVIDPMPVAGDKKLPLKKRKELYWLYKSSLPTEIAKVKSWLLTNKVVLTGVRDGEMDRFEYKDYRTEEEMRSTLVEVHNMAVEEYLQKKWWQFWK